MDELIKLDQVDEIDINLEPANEIDLDLGEVLGVVRPPELEKVEVTPTKETQVIKPSKFGTYIEEAKVYPIPDEYADITGVTASAEDVLNGKVFVDNQGNEVQGTAELKEDLDAELTAQDEAITRLTIAVDELPEEKGAKEIVIDLPSEFNTSTEVYHFQLNSDTLLFSANQQIGVWAYKISDNSFTQVYSSNYGWKYFVQVSDDKCLISGKGLLLYNSITNTVSMILSSYYGSTFGAYFQNMGTKWLLGGASTGDNGIVIYDSETDEVTQDRLSTYGYRYFCKISDTKCLVSGSGTNAGIFIYDSIVGTFTKIYETGNRWEYFHYVGGDYIIASGSSSNKGLLLYQSSDDTVTQIYTTGYYWTSCLEAFGKYLISGSSTNGLLLFNPSDNSVVSIMSTGSNYAFGYIVGDRFIFSSMGANGIWLYSPADDSVTQLSTVGRKFETWFNVGDKYVSSSSDLDYGLFAYNPSEYTVTNPFTKGTLYDICKIVENGAYLSSSLDTNNRVLYYNSQDNTAVTAGIKLKVV